MNQAQRGYTLAEMLVVVAMIGVLTLITVPFFINYFETNKMKSSVRNFETDLRTARQLAITNGVESKLNFSTGASGTRTYNIWLGSAANGAQTWTRLTSDPGTTPGRYGFTRMLDPIAYFPANDTSSPQTFTDLDSDGTLDVVFLPNGGIQMPGTNTSATISLKTDLTNVFQQIYQFIVSPSGRISVQ